MQPGLIIAFRHIVPESGLFYRLVAASTMGSYFHVETFPAFKKDENTYLRDEGAYTAFVGETFHKFTRPYGYYSPHDWDFIFVPLDAAQLQNATRWADSEKGSRYDMFGAFSCPFFPVHTWTKQKLRAPEKIFCSEAVLYMLHASGALVNAKHIKKLAPRHCSPAALARELRKEPVPGMAEVAPNAIRGTLRPNTPPPQRYSQHRCIIK